MSEYNIQMNKYNALNAGYDQLYPQPMKHANTHAEDGNDPITPSMIGTYNKTEIDIALQNKAPAGYGLGTNAKFLTSADDANDIWQSGWYRYDSAPKNGISLSYLHAMRVDGYSNGVFVQTVYGLTDNVNYQICPVARRFRYGTKITPWEYENPPMIPGVEYRTTERYLGKTVYKKLIEFPSLTGYDYVYVYSRYGYVFHVFGEVETQYDNPDIAGTKYWNTIFPESTAPTDDIAYIALTNNYSVQVGVVLPKGTNSAYYGKKARVQVWYYKPED